MKFKKKLKTELKKLNLLKTSFSVSLIGIFLLLLLANISTPKQISIGNITDKLLNKKVQVQGTIFNIKSYENSNFQVISIKDSTGKVDVITNQILDLKNSDEILIIGTIKEYKQYLQIQADKIIILELPDAS